MTTLKLDVSYFSMSIPFFLCGGFLWEYSTTRVKWRSNGVRPVCQDDPCHGDLGTLANVVTSLGHLNKSSDDGNDLMGVDSLSNGDSSMTDMQAEEQSASEITR